MTEVNYYLNQAGSGDVDAALHGLIELGNDAIQSSEGHIGSRPIRRLAR